MAGQRIIPQRLELDLGNEYCTPEVARFIKNLSFFRSDTSEVSNNQSGAAGKYKPLEATTVFDDAFTLPLGYNHFLGAYTSGEDNVLLFHYYNENGNHLIGKISGDSPTVQTVYQGPCLNYQLNPQNFIHEGGAYLEIFKYNDPVTGISKKRSYYNYTDGYNDMRFICIEDSIATSGFNSTLFPYFINPHDKCLLINAGVPKPKGCISIVQVPNDNPSAQNQLRFNTWQFMVRDTDVYGRPSEWGDISEIYIPGENDCIGSSDLLPRCLDLSFDAGGPLVNIKEVAFRNCNDLQWYSDTYLFLYKGTNLGDWWLRPRNPDVNFNAATNTITYRFCKDKECNPVDQNETNRTQNPLPRVSQSVSKIGKFIAPSNNLHGFFPFGNDIMDDISIKVDAPSQQADQLRNIEIFVPIWNVYISTQQPVYQIDNKQWVWGGRKDQTDDYVNGIVTNYEMYFGDTDRSGFIGYIAANGLPPANTVSELYYVDDTNEMIKVEDFNIIHQPSETSGIFSVYKRKYFLKFSFNNVSPAIYVFRIADHKAKLGDANFYNTSTYVAGQYSWVGKEVNFSNRTNVAKELVIDVCNNNYNSIDDNKVLVIWDMTEPRNSGTSRSKIVSGYIYEQKIDNVYTTPIELLNTNIYGDDNRNGNISDHNGFYFGSVRRDNGFDVEIFGFCGCTFKSLRKIRVNSNFDGAHDRTFDMQSDQYSTCQGYVGQPCNRIIISGKVTECGTGIGVPGVGIVLTRGRMAVTDSSGEYSIIAHDDSYSPSHIRFDKIYFTPTTCQFKGCSTVCVEPYDVIINPCSYTPCDIRAIVVTERGVLFEQKRGLLSGGNYGVSIWGEDWLGRHGFAQTKDSLYFNTHTLIQSQTLAPSIVTLTIPATVTFPSWVTEIHIGITKELSMGGQYISWIVDDVEFVDNSGQVNDAAPTQIKIYYASLNEYNIQNNFNTTTHWQFIVQAAPQTNYTSDYVEFYINGDGSFFPTLTRALIKYDQTGQYFLIDYNTALKDLTKYALIRLGRPQVCATKDVFYDSHCSIKVVNGKPVQNVIILNAFDTYYKYRQIPIPVQVADNQTENVTRSFGFPFEHHSPSDLWGDHCINIGKQNVRNPYESEIVRENHVMLSGALSVNGQLNYLNYFDDKLAIDFDSWDFGGITSGIPFVGGVYFICNFNCFAVGFNDNTLRVNANGQVIIPSADSRFGNPEVKIGGDNGCSLFDKNTIRKEDGKIQFIDSRKGGLIQSNYSQETIVSKIDLSKEVTGGVDSWLRAKIKYIQQWNKGHVNKKYFHGTINPAAREYLLSDFTIRSTDYVNNERAIRIEKHETLVFDYLANFFREFISPTPQGYGYMEGQIKDLQLFSFTNKIYTHYTTDEVKVYNIFYGTSVNRVIRIVMVLDGMQKKQFQNLTVMGKHLYFADVVLTDSGQRSRILKAAFRQGDGYWGAPILCNLDSPVDSNVPDRTVNSLMDGQKMYGSIIDIRLIGNPADDNIFTELLGLIVEVQAEGKVLP
jgi:hypothetical protein